MLCACLLILPALKVLKPFVLFLFRSFFCSFFFRRFCLAKGGGRKAVPCWEHSQCLSRWNRDQGWLSQILLGCLPLSPELWAVEERGRVEIPAESRFVSTQQWCRELREPFPSCFQSQVCSDQPVQMSRSRTDTKMALFPLQCLSPAAAVPALLSPLVNNCFSFLSFLS